MATHRKLIVAALALVGATTGLALWQSALPANIERVARRLPECNTTYEWVSNQEVTCESVDGPPLPILDRDIVPDLDISWALDRRGDGLHIVGVPHRADATVERFSQSDDAKHILIILRVKTEIQDQDAWEYLLHHKWSREHREFWVVHRSGESPCCLATDNLTNDPDKEINWSVLNWSPNAKRILLFRTEGLLPKNGRGYLLEI